MLRINVQIARIQDQLHVCAGSDLEFELISKIARVPKRGRDSIDIVTCNGKKHVTVIITIGL